MPKKIFALEGEWSSSIDSKLSIKSALQFLKEIDSIEYIYRRCSLEKTLQYYLKRLSNYKSYELVYFAFHGNKSLIELEDKSITLKELAIIAGNSLKGKYIHFGSCKTAVDKNVLKEFKKDTGAITVSGFSKNINFFEGTIIDMAIIHKVASLTKPTKFRTLHSNFDSLVEDTGFVIV